MTIGCARELAVGWDVLNVDRPWHCSDTPISKNGGPHKININKSGWDARRITATNTAKRPDMVVRRNLTVNKVIEQDHQT